MSTAQILASLSEVTFDPGCVVADDPGSITRHSWEPMPEAERKKWETDRLEWHIQRLRGAR